MENNENKEEIGLRPIIVKYLLHWRLFLIAFAISLIPALLYLFLYPPTYQINALIQLQDNSRSGGSFGLGEAAGLMKSFGLGGGSSTGINMDNELMLLTSNELISRMALETGVNVEYKRPFSFLRQYDNNPFVLKADSVTTSRLSENLKFSVKLDKGSVKVVSKSKRTGKKEFQFASLPATIELQQGTFILDYSGKVGKPTSDKINISIRPPKWAAEDLEKEFYIEESSKLSDVVEMSYMDYEIKRGVDMLNTLIRKYNEESNRHKKQEAEKTLVFLNDRIEMVTKDLFDVEYKIEIYKNDNKLTDIKSDIQFYIEQVKELQARIVELEIQSQSIKTMEGFVKDPANKYNLVPVLLNSPESEGSTIATYNSALLERARIIQNSNPSNPLAQTLTDRVDQLRETVFLTISNARNSVQISIEDLRNKEKQLYNKMKTYPTQERQYIDLKRQQEIFQGVYLILLQKREETALAIGEDKEKAYILDAAYAKSRPIGPRKLYAAIGMLIFTFVIPVIYLFIKEQFISLMKLYKESK